MSVVNELFIRTKTQIDELSAETVEPLAVSLLQLVNDSRIRFLQQKLTEKLNEACVALCIKAKSLDKFEPATVKSMYDQLCMVVKARSILDEHVNVMSANRLLSKSDKDASGKLVVQCELNAIMRKKLDKLVDELKEQPSADADFDDDMVQEYGEYCYYLAGLDESSFSATGPPGDDEDEVYRFYFVMITQKSDQHKLAYRRRF